MEGWDGGVFRFIQSVYMYFCRAERLTPRERDREGERLKEENSRHRVEASTRWVGAVGRRIWV